MGQPPSGGCILSCEHRRPNLNVESFIMLLACTCCFCAAAVPAAHLARISTSRAHGLICPVPSALFLKPVVPCFFDKLRSSCSFHDPDCYFPKMGNHCGHLFRPAPMKFFFGGGVSGPWSSTASVSSRIQQCFAGEPRPLHRSRVCRHNGLPLVLTNGSQLLLLHATSRASSCVSQDAASQDKQSW